jgi:hypothetical protein
MTYRELAEYISKLNDEQKDSDVTVFVADQDEFYPLVAGCPVSEAKEIGEDRLDEGHPYLVI